MSTGWHWPQHWALRLPLVCRSDSFWELRVLLMTPLRLMLPESRRHSSISGSWWRVCMDRHNRLTMQPYTWMEVVSFHTTSYRLGDKGWFWVKYSRLRADFLLFCACRVHFALISSLNSSASLRRQVNRSSTRLLSISLSQAHRRAMPNLMNTFHPSSTNRCHSLLTTHTDKSSEKSVVNQLVAKIQGQSSAQARHSQILGRQLQMKTLSTQARRVMPAIPLSSTAPRCRHSIRQDRYRQASGSEYPVRYMILAMQLKPWMYPSCGYRFEMFSSTVFMYSCICDYSVGSLWQGLWQGLWLLL